MRIVLLENLDEAKQFLNEKGKAFFQDSNNLAISLEPKVESFLKREGIPCQNTAPYFNNDSHRRIVDKTEEVLRKCLKKVKFQDQLGLSNTYEHFFAYHLRFYLNYFFTILEILEGLRKAHRLDEVYAFKYQFFATSQAIMHEKSERYLSVLVERYCKEYGIKAHLIEAALSNQKPNLKRVIESAVSLLVNIYFRVYSFFAIHRIRPGEKYVAVSTWGYKFDDIINRIRAKNPGVKVLMVMADEMPFQRKIRLVLMTLPFVKKYKLVDMLLPINFCGLSQREDPILSQCLRQVHRQNFEDTREDFRYLSVTVLDLAFDKLEKGWIAETRRLAAFIKSAKDIFSRAKPQLFMSPYSTGFYAGLGELSRVMGFSSCIITHGTHVPPNNRCEEIENYWLSRGVVFNDYQTVAVQTPWMKKFMEYYRDNRHALVTGPLIFSEQRNSEETIHAKKQRFGIPMDRKIILYATTQRLLVRNRLYITETPDEFLSTLTDLVNIVNQVEGLHLIIRPHPACDLSAEDFERLLPQSKRFTVLNKGRFEDVLSLSDCLVSYSSTTIEEALTNGIPVVLYDKWKRYNHFNVPELNGGPYNFRETPVAYFTFHESLKQYFQTFAKDFKRNSLDPQLLRPYRYSLDENKNFYDYVDACLKGAN